MKKFVKMIKQMFAVNKSMQQAFPYSTQKTQTALSDLNIHLMYFVKN